MERTSAGVGSQTSEDVVDVHARGGFESACKKREGMYARFGLMISFRSGVVLTEQQQETLLQEFAADMTLQDVIRRGFAASPPREVVSVVIQDEYTHDVVMTYLDGLFLCFDTT